MNDCFFLSSFPIQTESIYSGRTAGLTGTLDRHMNGPRGISSVPIRSLSTQHIGGTLPLRSPSIRRMRQLLELGGPASPSSGMSGHQSPAPTPSTTLPRPHRQIDINPAEFSKYKLDKPGKLPSSSSSYKLITLSSLFFTSQSQ